jgi:hypothetical protein
LTFASTTSAFVSTTSAFASTTVARSKACQGLGAHAQTESGVAEDFVNSCLRCIQVGGQDGVVKGRSAPANYGKARARTWREISGQPLKASNSAASSSGVERRIEHSQGGP